MINLNEAKIFLAKPVVIASSCIVVLWLLFDFAGRIITSTTATNKAPITQDLSDLASLSISDEQHQQILSLYERYKLVVKKEPVKPPVVPVKQVPKGLSSAEQLKQQGFLDKVYIGDNKIELKATIGKKLNKTTKSIALILVTNVKTNKKELMQFAHQSDVFGYNMRIDSNTQVTLTREQQKIMLTMYKK